MNWAKGFSATYRAFKVNPGTWEDEEEIRVISGSVSRDVTAELVESATLELTDSIGESWVRVYLIAEQDDKKEREALFTGLTSQPSKELDGMRTNYSVDCFSVLKPAADILLPLGWYGLAGQDAGELLSELLSVVPAPVKVTGTARALDEHIVAQGDETALSMARTIASAVGYQIRISGRGEIIIADYSSAPVQRFGRNNDVLETEITDTKDWYSCPNVLRVICDSTSAIARDDDPESPLSTVSRGREIWVQENVSLSSGASLSSYAMERLKELQKPSRILDYSRRYDPDVMPGDVIEMAYPDAELTGLFRVITQDLELGYGCRTEEEAYEA